MVNRIVELSLKHRVLVIVVTGIWLLVLLRA